MDTEQITVDREEARELFRKYKEHQHYSTPVDVEIMRAYDAVAKGKVLIRAVASIASAGLGEDGLPKLAICRAADDQGRLIEQCHLYLKSDGGARFATSAWAKDRNWRTYVDIPAGSFPDSRLRNRHYAAQVPLVPIHLRPKPRQGNPLGALANYHVLWEAEWTRVVPRDPLLLRQVGRGDLWIVCAAWDLTDIERAVLAGRLPS
jgi:hypothetical protein